MNNLSREKQIEVIAALCEGVGIRTAARLTGVNRGTVGNLDERMFRTSTPSAVALLASRLLEPTASADFGAADLAVIKDKWAEYQAMAVLFPEEARDEFFTLFKDGKITVEEISKRLVLPVDKVAFVMTTHWPKVLESLKGID
jgi:hypothetical protein